MTVTLGNTGVTVNAVTYTAPPVDTGAPISMTAFTSNGTYTVPSNCYRVLVQCQGGGGGSAGYCESGGAGGFAEGHFTVTPNSAIAVTVGGGGALVGYYAGAGAGGSSSFGSYISASGGYGANNNYSHGGGHGGVGSGGQINLYGGTGTGHANHANHCQDGNGGGGYFGGPPASARHHDGSASNYGYALGAGATGNNGDGGHHGSNGAAGLVIVYAYT